jgi:hypothetical protein
VKDWKVSHQPKIETFSISPALVGGRKTRLEMNNHFALLAGGCRGAYPVFSLKNGSNG